MRRSIGPPRSCRRGHDGRAVGDLGGDRSQPDPVAGSSRGRRRSLVLGGVLLATSLLLAACTGGGSSASGSSTATTVSGPSGAAESSGSITSGASAATAPPAGAGAALPPAAQEIVDSPVYAHGSWHYNAVDLGSGKTLYARDENELNSSARPRSCSRSGPSTTSSAPTRHWRHPYTPPAHGTAEPWPAISCWSARVTSS